jgi:hypothetical protein
MRSRHTDAQPRCVPIVWRAGAVLALLAAVLISGGCGHTANSSKIRRALAARRAEVAMREVMALTGDLDGSSSGGGFGEGTGGGAIRIKSLSRSGSGGGGSGGGGGGGGAGGRADGSGEPDDGDSGGDDAAGGYTFHLNLTTNPKFFNDTGIAWHELIDFGDAPVVRDVTIFYNHMLGDFPEPGPHLIAADPTWMSRHLVEVERDLDKWIPNTAYNGYAVIDYEHWNLQWDRLYNRPSDGRPQDNDKDWRDDWRDYISSVTPDFDALPPWEQERILRETYDATAREFYLATIQACTQQRPAAKWGVWGYPQAPRNDENPAQRRARNDELAWLWSSLTAVTPKIYAQRYTVPDGEAYDPARGENSETENRELILSVVQEAVRVAGGKPVEVYFWPRYSRTLLLFNAGLAGEFVNDLNLKHGLEVPAEGGANGVIIWYGIRNEDRFNEFQAYVTETLVPAIKEADARMNGAEN